MFQDLSTSTQRIPKIRQQVLGYSVQGRPIQLWQLTQGIPSLLLMGGVHGNEVEGYNLIEQYVISGLWGSLAGRATVWVIPRLNPDGCAVGQRVNANGVDLNRNMPTQDWLQNSLETRYPPGPAPASEPETQALLVCLEQIQPWFILSAHSCEDNPCVNYNGPALELAQVMAAHNGLPITNDIGYPTPGSLGTWAGQERQIPTLTLEVLRGTPLNQVWQEQAQALQALLTHLSDVEEGPTLAIPCEGTET
ncbi:MAG: M14 family zinc carboxypeptidase [Cyanobacteriota bacterium]